MRRLVLCGVLAGLLAAAGSGAATKPTPFPGTASWADARHGWAPDEGYGVCPRAWEAFGDSHLCSTEDGGRTWRMIFVGGNYIFNHERTSAQAGIVSTGAWGHYEYWTRDNGKHWYGVTLDGLGQSKIPRFAGRGDRLYYAGWDSDTVYQLTPWPPQAPASCAAGWSRSIVEEEPDPAGNVCLDPVVDTGTHSVPVVMVDGDLLQFARVPDGFFALFSPRPSDEQLTTVVRRADANMIRKLPAASFPGGTLEGDLRLAIEWPSITVVGLYRTKAPDYMESQEVVWRSTDGGATWSMRQRRGWTLESRSPTARSRPAAGVVGNEIVLAGGYVPARGEDGGPYRASRRVDAYRPSADRWRSLPGLPAARARAAGASTGRELYVVGGLDQAGRLRREAFVLRAGRWHRLPSAPEARAAAGAAIVADKLYVVGGYAHGGLVRRMLVLDLRTKRWSLAPGPRPRRHLGVAAVRGRIVALGGSGSGPDESMALVEGWRPGEHRWRRLAPLPSRRIGVTAIAHGGRVLSVGGSDHTYSEPLVSVAALDLDGGRWEALPGLGTPRRGPSVAVVAGRLYALWGGDSWFDPNYVSNANESLSLGD